MTFGKSLALTGLVTALSLAQFGARAQDTTATATSAASAPLYNLEPGTVLEYESKSALRMIGPQPRSQDITLYETFTVLAKKGDVLTVLASIDGLTTVGEAQERMPIERFSFELPVAGAGAMSTLKTSHEVQMPHPLWQLESFFPVFGDVGSTTRSVAVPAMQHIAELPGVVTKSGDSTKLTISSKGLEQQIQYDSVATLDGKTSSLSDKLTSVTTKIPQQTDVTLSLDIDTKRTGTSKIDAAKLAILTKDVAAGIAVGQLLRQYNPEAGKESSDKLLAKLDEYLKSYPEGIFHKSYSMMQGNLVRMIKTTANAEKVADGRVAPDFKAKTIDGKDISLADYKGKTVLLDFWATWCGPCVQEMPTMKAIHEKYTTQGLTIIGISADEAKSDLTEFVKEYELGWPQIFDGDTSNAIQVEYGIMQYPTLVMINKEGKIITVPPRVRGEALTEFVGEVLAGKPPKAKQEEALNPEMGTGQPMVIPSE